MFLALKNATESFLLIKQKFNRKKCVLYILYCVCTAREGYTQREVRKTETVTEPRMTEPRKTEPRKTERRKTVPRMTEPQMTESRK